MPTMRWTAAADLVPVLCIIAIAGAALYSLVAPAPQTPELDAASGRRAVIEGVVVRDPDIREHSVRLTVRPDTLNSDLIYQVTANVIISADRFTEIVYGDRIKANGILGKPKPFETDSGRTFDYPMYLRAHGVSHEMNRTEVTVLESGKGNLVVGALLSVAHLLDAGIKRALPEPESALLGGLILGEKQSLGEDITNAFRRAGVVHIIVLSGYNVSLVIASVMFVANRFLRKQWALLIASLAIVAFAVMTGASETTLRASLMALIIILATALGRPAAGLRILLIAAAAMALWNPFLVLFDLSYQLSILATLGLILFSPEVAKRITFVTERLGLREIVATTIATQITVLPLLVLSIGAVSLVFLPANILILPLVPAAMLFGFIASVLVLISYALAFPFIAVAYGILAFVIKVATLFGSLPFASIAIPESWLWCVLALLAACYAVLFWRFFKRKEPQRGSFVR